MAKISVVERGPELLGGLCYVCGAFHLHHLRDVQVLAHLDGLQARIVKHAVVDVWLVHEEGDDVTTGLVGGDVQWGVAVRVLFV